MYKLVNDIMVAIKDTLIDAKIRLEKVVRNKK